MAVAGRALQESGAMDIGDDLMRNGGTAGEFAIPIADPAAMRASYLDQGYVVIRGAVPRAICAAALAAFEHQVKPSRAYFRRHPQPCHPDASGVEARRDRPQRPGIQAPDGGVRWRVGPAAGCTRVAAG